MDFEKTDNSAIEGCKFAEGNWQCKSYEEKERERQHMEVDNVIISMHELEMKQDGGQIDKMVDILKLSDNLLEQPQKHAECEVKKSRIQVVVRKRPISPKEQENDEIDVVVVDPNYNCIRIHEPKVKVDLTKYIQNHDFLFDAVHDENATNMEIYDKSVKPLLESIFYEKEAKATCFAYGQTGSGKTYTLLGSEDRNVQGIYILAVKDIYQKIELEMFQHLKVMVSFYEIYSGKLFDLLANRAPIVCREDGQQKVNIVGLKRILCPSSDELMKTISMGGRMRQIGTTGANDSSSRSHAILVLDLVDAEKEKLQGRISFIDLAGSERGADTFNNSKQIRKEGAEINKSLLALKECIRALDQGQSHKPFRGSKLTQVLKESFIGNSRTVMIANISPNNLSCENTLNTLRYANRVKELKGTTSSRDPPFIFNNSSETSVNKSEPKILDFKSPNCCNEQGIEQLLSKSMTVSNNCTNVASSLGSARRLSFKKTRTSHPIVHKYLLSQRKSNRVSMTPRTPQQNSSPRVFTSKCLPPTTITKSIINRSTLHAGRKIRPFRLHTAKNISSNQYTLDINCKSSPALGNGINLENQENNSLINNVLVDSNKKEGKMTENLDENPSNTSYKKYDINYKSKQKQLISNHRNHLNQFTALIKENAKLLKDFDKGILDTKIYTDKLQDLLTRETTALLRFQDQIKNGLI